MVRLLAFSNRRDAYGIVGARHLVARATHNQHGRELDHDSNRINRRNVVGDSRSRLAQQKVVTDFPHSYHVAPQQESVKTVACEVDNGPRLALLHGNKHKVREGVLRGTARGSKRSTRIRQITGSQQFGRRAAAFEV